MKRKVFYINARFLTQQISGVQRFAIEISKELKKSDIPFVFLAPKNILHKEIANELGARTIGFLKGHLWEQVELQSYVFVNKGFLISFCNTAPLFLKKQIVTVHDLCFRMHPEWFSKNFSTFYNFMIPIIVKNSEKVLTVSNVSKKEIMKELGVSDEKISVIYNAVASSFGRNINDDSKPIISGKYILSVSSHHPRKNFNRLIKAFKRMNDYDIKLCVIGNRNVNFVSTDLESDQNIIFLQNISDSELVNYYKFAELFVYPSLYEGFGIPIIESLKMGTQVCVSNIPVFNEICCEHAVYFNPYDVEDIKSKILKLLNNKMRFRDEDLPNYSWEEGANKIINLILSNDVFKQFK